MDSTTEVEAKMRARNRIYTLKQRARNYRTEIIQRGIDSGLSIKIVDQRSYVPVHWHPEPVEDPRI